MNSFDSQRQEPIRGRWQERRVLPNISNRFGAGDGGVSVITPPPCSPSMANTNVRFQTFPGFDDDDLVSAVVPAVTVVLEGRSICQRISLHKHASYQSLAKALRQMFVDCGDAELSSETDLDLSNAVPGHLVAYEDMENDLLLAGDLNWKDFVRVAKRIRILPVKRNPRKGRGGD